MGAERRKAVESKKEGEKAAKHERKEEEHAVPMRKRATGLSVSWNQQSMGPPGTRASRSRGLRGGPQEIARREIVHGIGSVRCHRGPWRMMPHDVLTWRTVHQPFREGNLAGIWEPVYAARRREVRISLGRDPEPSAAMLDRPSLTTSSMRGETRGSAGGKTSEAEHGIGSWTRKGCCGRSTCSRLIWAIAKEARGCICL